jgi:flagellar biosynthetic protein FliR
MAFVEQLLNLSEQQMTYALLLFLRMTGLFVLSPVLGRNNVPATVKIGLALVLSYIFLAAYPPGAGIDASNLLAYALLCVKELLIGLVLGYLTTLFFDVVVMAGQIMDIQIGFGLAQIFDPGTQTVVSMVGDFLNYGLLLLFFVANDHLALIKILGDSFQSIPVGQVVARAGVLKDLCVNAFSSSIAMAVSVALPVMAAEVILEVVMGIMIRSVPQLNIFVVGISVKILAGLFALALVMPFFGVYGERIFSAMFESIGAFLKGMVPG